MPMKKIEPKELVEKAGDLFRVRGYHNTSIADIAESCNLSKASIYHHINSKIELAEAAIAQVQEYFDHHIFGLAYHEKPSVLERIVAFFAALKEYFMSHPSGCLIANIASEVIDSEPKFKKALQAFFNGWTGAVTHLLITAGHRQQPEMVARDIVSQFHGALLLQRIFPEYNILGATLDQLKESILTLVHNESPAVV